MERFKIIHRTYYNYSDNVNLGTHNLLLRPRENHELRIELFTLNITPKAKILWHLDVEDNSVAIATFETPTQQLFIESEVIIQQYNESPLDFIVADYAINYPFKYLPNDNFILSSYMVLPNEESRILLNNWIGNVYKYGEKIQTYTLLQKLTTYIFKNFTYKVREEAGVQTAKQTLTYGSGSCRDFAFLFMEAVKCLGLATRFVSGYLYAPLMSDQAGSTHAWAEVYLPGGGWKGFDPTTGNIVGTDHISVAVSRLPDNVPPIAGSFSGISDSTLSVGVWVTKV
ncbi:transglutaminase family protein [Arcobacter venerupis]|uniref:Transglutaminase family protein n=1 Tax=Arcobacter venerupis TaxID=1054033 RepID=A0AAE7B8Q4_9BACT|nr:transglutaminase family protein [Arcobacter venerupis]QKF67394.1 transglutaminase family protein [Arcobacter venerupis]RWS50591.1 cysteine protease [Arcobacter venerupis]